MSYLKKNCCICDREINFYSLICNQIQQLYAIIPNHHFQSSFPILISNPHFQSSPLACKLILLHSKHVCWQAISPSSTSSTPFFIFSLSLIIPSPLSSLSLLSLRWPAMSLEVSKLLLEKMYSVGGWSNKS